MNRIQEQYEAAARQREELRRGEAHAEPSKLKRCTKPQDPGIECCLVDGHEREECMRCVKM